LLSTHHEHQKLDQLLAADSCLIGNEHGRSSAAQHGRHLMGVRPQKFADNAPRQVLDVAIGVTDARGQLRQCHKPNVRRQSPEEILHRLLHGILGNSALCKESQVSARCTIVALPRN
jgi:hypothetical protein